MGLLEDRRQARWLRQVRGGDARAFRRLYDELYPPVEAYVARRVGDAADRDDLVATCFERALDRIAQFDPARGSVRMWVFGIARRLVIDHHRAARRGSRADPLALYAAADDGDPLAALLRDEAVSMVRAAVLELDESQRELLSLRYGEGLRNTEIAALLGLEEAAVRQRLSRLRRQLRRRLRADPKGAPDHAF